MRLIHHSAPRLAMTLVAALALPALAPPADAQPWHPTRAIEIIVPSTPGGGLDTTGRTLQRLLQEGKYSDEPATVLNKPGGAGTIGIAYMNQHRADGHEISVQSPPLLTNSIVGTSPISLKNVTPVALLVTEEIIFSVNADSDIRSGTDLIERLRKDPDSVSIAVSSSPGGHSHAAAALVMKAAGGDPKRLKMVFFGSGADVATALMGGHVTVGVTPATSILGDVEAGKLRVVGIPAAHRLGGLLADVPTWQEQGIDVVFGGWRSLVGPRGITPAQLAWWDATLAQLTATQQWQADVRHNLWTADYKDSKETALFFAAEQRRLAEILGELGLAK